MTLHENDVVDRLHAVAEGFEMPRTPAADDVRRGRRRLRRNRGLVTGAALATVTVVLGISAIVGGQSRPVDEDHEPVERPKGVEVRGPVWYDAAGLHHGDVVEQTPVEIGGGALALVRSGAVYLHPSTGDVWFQPWGGEARIVGHSSSNGPGGDPNGDTAAWFDDSELVVYDTATSTEISRTAHRGGVEILTGDHNPAGNSFLQVSAQRVVWRHGAAVLSHDVLTGETTKEDASQPRFIVDVHDGFEAFRREVGRAAMVLSVPGRADRTYTELEPRFRFSPSGTYAVAIQSTATRHASAIIDVRTGDLWPVPVNEYSYLAWSYGDIALVETETALFACDAASRTCESVAAQRPVLMPTS
jgi:hypothetical protein